MICTRCEITIFLGESRVVCVKKQVNIDIAISQRVSCWLMPAIRWLKTLSKWMLSRFQPVYLADNFISMRFLFFIFIFISSSVVSIAQYYTSGEDPASVRWRQIKTPHFTIVYPSEMEEDARRVAVILDQVRGVSRYSDNHQPRQFNVLMHGRSAISNGFVAWAPRRMELYPMGGTSVDPQDWLEHLTTHEYRHVVQIDRMNRGFTRWLYYGFGQQAVGGMLGLHIPMWYLEGDATLSETLLTDAGRGRMPWFEQRIRAQILDKGAYSYDKAYFGSYRDFVPNYYEMGYHLVAGTRQLFGAKAWVNTIDGTARNSWWPFSFSHQLKKQTGFNKTDLYRHVFDSLASKWQFIDKQVVVSDGEPMHKSTAFYRNYLNPRMTPNGAMIAEVSGPSDVQRFVKIMPDGGDSTLYVPGFRSDETFSCVNNQLAWAEYRMDLRWDNARHSIIRLLDITTGKARTVGSARGKRFAPALSPVKPEMAWVSVNDSNRCAIDIVSLTDDRVIASFPIGRQMVTGMSWNDDGTQLATVLATPEGKKLSLLDVATGQWHDLLPASRTEIRNISIKGNQVFYASGEDGMENICSVDIFNGQVLKHTSARFGATTPCVDSRNQLFYSEYTSNGYRVVKASLNSIPDSLSFVKSIELYKGLEDEEPGKATFDYSQTTQYQSKPYSKWQLLNFHSWAPANISPVDRSVSRGVSVMSQNLLNTLTLTMGYNGDRNYQSEKYNATLRWTGWFPVLSLELMAGDTRVEKDGFYTSTKKDSLYLIEANATQRHLQLKPGISLPLDLSRGVYSRKIIPSVKYTFYRRTGYDYTQTPGVLVDGYFYPDETKYLNEPDYISKGIELDLFAYNLRNGSSRDVAIRWGQVIQVNHRANMGSTIDRGAQTALLTRLYLPGLGRHHAIKIENNFQRKFDGQNKTTVSQNLIPYLYGSIVTMPRGFSSSDAQKIYSFKGDYLFPICYPDFSLGGVAFVKRLKGGVFYDFAVSERELTNSVTGIANQTIRNDYSVGYELRSDLHLFRFIYPIELGYRQAFLPQSGKVFGEMLLNVAIQ
jgi:hypothetical protein